MRSHVRRWMNEWDLKRLYPGATVSTEEQELRPTYEEDEALEEIPSSTNDQGSQSEAGHNALSPALVTAVGDADGPDRF